MGALANLTKKQQTGGGALGRLTSSSSKGSSGPNLSTVQGLRAYAASKGLEDKVDEILDQKNHLSVLQRLGKGLGALNPAEAILTGAEKGIASGVGKYISGAGKGVASAVTGTDHEGERRTFADVVSKLGIQNSVAKFGLGVVGDILLDPSTYFGGAIARGFLGATKGATNVALKGVGKVAPETEAGLRLAGKGLQDAAGGLFKFGYGTSKGLAPKALELQSQRDAAKLGIVTSNLNRLGTGTLSESQQEMIVKGLLEGKRAEFATGRGTAQGQEAGRKALLTTLAGADSATQQAAIKQTSRSAKFAGQAGIKDPFAVYFPGIREESINKFFEGTKGLRVGSEGYLKEFRDLLTDEQMIMNPAEAFAKTEFRIADNNIVRNQLHKIIQEYGLPLNAFKTADDAARAGYQVIKDAGQYGKEVGYLLNKDRKFLDDFLRPEFTSIDTIAKATGFDALTALFKRSVTGLFLPFHARNYVSGNIQNFEVLGKDALNPINIAMGQKMAYKLSRGGNFGNKIIEVGGKQMNLGKLMRAFQRRFGGSSQYIADIGDITADGFKQSSKFNILAADKPWFRATRAIGNFIETQQKATAYITALGQGKSMTEALNLAEKSGFDYRALTGFESKILRRIIPFYAFARKNVGLQLSTLGENPQRINQIFSLIENVDELTGEKLTKEEQSALPEYLRASFGIKLEDTPDGLAQYISSFGTPIEAFTDLMNQNPILKGISQMNPLIKPLIEIGIGKDSFRQRDLKDVYDAREYKAAPQIVKDILDIHETQKPILKKMPNGKLIKVGERTQYIADPVKLLIARSLFTSRGVSYLDQAFGGDLNGFAKVLKLTTGLKPQQIDIEQQQSINESMQRRAIEDELAKYSALSKYTKTYVPQQ